MNKAIDLAMGIYNNLLQDTESDGPDDSDRALGQYKAMESALAAAIHCPQPGPWQLIRDIRSGWWLENAMDDAQSTEWYGTEVDGQICVNVLNFIFSYNKERR